MYQTYQEKIGRQIKSLRTLQRNCRRARQYYQLAAGMAHQGEIKNYFHTFAQFQADREQKLKREIIALNNHLDLMRTQLQEGRRSVLTTYRPQAGDPDFILLNSAIRLEKILLHSSQIALEDAAPGSSAFVLLIAQRNATRAVLDKLEELSGSLQRS